jgi:hypothetical protein
MASAGMGTATANQEPIVTATIKAEVKKVSKKSWR